MELAGLEVAPSESVVSECEGLGPYCTSAFSTFFFLFFFKDFIYFQRQGNGGRKRGRETSMCEKNINWLPLACPQLGTWPTTQACALSGNPTCNFLVHRPVLSPLSHIRQGDIQPFSSPGTHKQITKILKLLKLLKKYIFC